MTVIESRHPDQPDLIRVRVERRKPGNKVRGADRKGFHGSGMLAMLDEKVAQREQPTVDRSGVLIKDLRIIGADKDGDRIEDVLTAQGSALYEFLMAAARIQGLDSNEFKVSFDDAKRYLGISHNARLISLADQLRETTVIYDFVLDRVERWGEMPLLMTDFSKNWDGKQYIHYSMHNAIRRVILETEQYCQLEINAFPKFSSKYTARIYPRLALMAQMHETMRRPWRITPEELAEMIGFKFSGKFHFGNFEKGVLDPVRSDICQWVTRFKASYEVVRKPGRGNPVDYIEWTTTSATKVLHELRKAPLDAAGYEELRATITEHDKIFKLMPSIELLRLGKTRTRWEEKELLEMWKQALVATGKADDCNVPFTSGPKLLKGYQLFCRLQDHGVGSAFEMWVEAIDKKPLIKPQRPDPTRFLAKPAPAPKPQEQMTPEEMLALCDIEHLRWKPVIKDFFEEQFRMLRAAFVYLKIEVATDSDRDLFLFRLQKVIDKVHPAERAKEIFKLADAAVKELRAKDQALANQTQQAA
jgi:hypothetical protein